MIKTKQFWLMAEPNWALFGSEGGLPNPQFDQWVRVWSDIESRSSFAQSVSSDAMSLMLGNGFEYEEGQEPDSGSWAMYEWAADGQCWMYECGVEGDHHWWEIDDLIWGYGSEGLLWAVDEESHCIKSEMQMMSEISQMGFCRPEAVIANALREWHGEEEGLLP